MTLVSGTSLSLLGRSAISQAAGARSSQRAAPERVEPTDALKDPTSREYRELQDFKLHDREVRQHEQAHVAVGGQYVRGGPAYSYQRGPDGRQYAAGGEVAIDTTPIADNPSATIRKMQVVRRAALAPAEPSPQDRAVAVEAARKEAEARIDLRDEQLANRGPQDAVSLSADRQTDTALGRPRAEPALEAYRSAAASGTAQSPANPGLDLIA